MAVTGWMKPRQQEAEHMGRELRMVPPNYEHPKTRAGHPAALRDGLRFHEEATAWVRDCAAWDAGTHPALVKDPSYKDTCRYFWEWSGNPPNEDDYMLVGVPESERTHFQLYESTSEGSPVSPIFATLDELCAWAADNATTFAHFTATAEQWKEMLSDKGMVAHEEKLPNGAAILFV